MGVTINPSEFLIAPDDVAYYLQLLESPDREQWLAAEAVLIPFSQGRAVPDANQHRLIVDFDTAYIHNKHLMDAGALPIYTQHLVRAMASLKGLNFQNMELELGKLNRAITMLYLVVTLTLDDSSRWQCKSIKKPSVVQLGDPATDPMYPVRAKAQATREAIHAKYMHKPHHDLPPVPPTSTDSSLEYSNEAAPLSDDEAWSTRVESLYKLVLVPKWREYMGLFSALITMMAAGNVMDKRGFFCKRSFTEDAGGSCANLNTASNNNLNPDEQLYWNWMNREKAIKFLNRDTATYVQVRPEDLSHQRVEFRPPMGLQKAVALLEDPSVEYALPPLRTVTSLLRIVQRLTKRKPSLIRATLCRTQSLVWLKRVLSLRDPTSRLYALKLVKSQGRYLGHQFTCVHLLTEVYLHVRPELEDDWLKSDDDETSPLAKASEALLQGEVQAFHHKWYWSTLPTKPNAATTASTVSLAVQGLMDLDQDALDVDGGSLRKLVAELKLDPSMCAQYEQWLDAKNLKGVASTGAKPCMDWPIEFH
ncbi:hypothetical protein DYB32_009518 [Aphanomyces invadans]|uniref:Far11/STRP C-terminal domain-containing protein n=1 Tax=Aphanomyces invadans TaxID=157072 RepID=A0A3R6YSC9_9STRA|nr:hypothetical protein DYB32_009518 [Aphanomyces invadans]